MSRNAPPALSELLAAEHRRMGVDVRLGASFAGCHDGKIVLRDGTRWSGDLAIVGIGVRADDELARAAGIACDDGVFVDGHGRTTCPGIYAVGDVTRQRNPLSGRFERIETWSNARDQATAVARAMMDPCAPAYAGVPWYWTEQYELNVQVAGLPVGSECIVRGDPLSGSFSLVQMESGRLVGAACVNSARDFAALRRLIGEGASPPPEALADPATDLRKAPFSTPRGFAPARPASDPPSSRAASARSGARGPGS